MGTLPMLAAALRLDAVEKALYSIGI